jgi:hypothetical protein
MLIVHYIKVSCNFAAVFRSPECVKNFDEIFLAKQI